MPADYVGRFAPSPTGPLHFGSLLAAAASYLDARQAGGQWLLRIEDIDPPREQAGADQLIIDALSCYGFEWDGDVSYQSRSRQDHERALAYLIDSGIAYRCGCSRRDLASEPRGPLGIVYPGNCRSGTSSSEYAIRVRTTDAVIAFRDRIQGQKIHRLESETGDFIIHRRDGLIAYHLAVVVDDAAQGVTHIVRGIDLLDSTPRHIYLQDLLGLPRPVYAHIPVVEHPDGSKLSKLTGAKAIPLDGAAITLSAALRALGLDAPAKLRHGSVKALWEWAIPRWNPELLAGQSRIALQHYC